MLAGTIVGCLAIAVGGWRIGVMADSARKRGDEPSVRWLTLGRNALYVLAAGLLLYHLVKAVLS